MGKVVVKQVRSAAKSSQKQRDSLRSLKLGRIGKSAEFEDHPTIQGLIRSVEHLVVVETRGTGGDRGNHG
jgi:large subunit ribosomal protein L30